MSFPVQSCVVSCTNVCLDTCTIHARYKHDTNTIQTRGYDDTCGCSWIHASKHLIRSGYKLFPASIRTFGYGLDTIGYDRIRSDTCTQVCSNWMRVSCVYRVWSFRAQTILEKFKENLYQNVSNMYQSCIECIRHVSSGGVFGTCIRHVSCCIGSPLVSGNSMQV